MLRVRSRPEGSSLSPGPPRLSRDNDKLRLAPELVNSFFTNFIDVSKPVGYMMRMIAKPPMDHVSMAIPRTLTEAVDDWRRAQPRLPSRAAALRLLIEKGLEADKVPAPATKRGSRQ